MNVTGLNLPVGNVIKAPRSAGGDGGNAAVAAEEGINIKQGGVGPSSHGLTYILIIRLLSNKTGICSHASLLLLFAILQRRKMQDLLQDGGEAGAFEKIEFKHRNNMMARMLDCNYNIISVNIISNLIFFTLSH